MQDDLIAVTQADTVRAGELLSSVFGAEYARSDTNIEAVAVFLSAHRQQAEDAMRERCAAELDQRAEEVRVAAIGGGMDPMDASLLDYEYSHAATAIRATQARPAERGGDRRHPPGSIS